MAHQQANLYLLSHSDPPPTPIAGMSRMIVPKDDMMTGKTLKQKLQVPWRSVGGSRKSRNSLCTELPLSSAFHIHFSSS